MYGIGVSQMAMDLCIWIQNCDCARMDTQSLHILHTVLAVDMKREWIGYVSNLWE